MLNPSLSNSAPVSAATPSPIISLRGVKKAYHTPAGDFWALHGIDLEVYPGEFLGIIGKSGAGKTTLLNMISGIDALTEGEVLVNGVRVHDLDEDRLALWRGRTLGVITQNFLLMPTLTLLENVLLPMDFCGLWQGRKSVERARELLRQVELEEHIHKLPSAISGGQQQRVAIARALANDPPILLADEPTGRLDSGTAEGILHIFERLVAAGKTILMVTHDLSLERRFSRVVWIADGRLVADRQAALG
ncbi:ABC transporter ATP-binding protein [Thermanaerothrix daxensis]|uniref:ABC transporter ATP-binding protein n=1 Tax=Thermanaerothrix daxensis TaxID=869279 RepID=A0A0P6XGE0_9CHLR|nr:ABC transporter ATP-binding protein [Thermanaerothrix daxensis]KPL82336.1 ABC transporter ATP-binding protein [Thermanaerothrix daxensis]